MKICGFETSEKLYESENSLIYRTKIIDGKPSVILKVLKENHPSREELSRFHQEFALVQKINGVNTIKVHSLEKFNKTYVLIFEDIGGEALSVCLEQARPSFLELLKVAIEICQGLADIHAQNITHKDINPSNIIWNRKSNIVKIIDFGIASILERVQSFPSVPKVLEGNLIYMSPEQTGRMNRPLDYRTDFYSLGVALYELFTEKKTVSKRRFTRNDSLSCCKATCGSSRC